jgi:hypothetical protein
MMICKTQMATGILVRRCTGLSWLARRCPPVNAVRVTVGRAGGNHMSPLANVAASKRRGTTGKTINLQNGKSATVRVEDRGLFVAGRAMDVTFKVAQELGITEERRLAGRDEGHRCASSERPSARTRVRSHNRPNFVMIGSSVTRSKVASSVPCRAHVARCHSRNVTTPEHLVFVSVDSGTHGPGVLPAAIGFPAGAACSR